MFSYNVTAGCCFIKYASSEEADIAIRALHNQYTLPGVYFLLSCFVLITCTSIYLLFIHELLYRVWVLSKSDMQMGSVNVLVLSNFFCRYPNAHIICLWKFSFAVNLRYEYLWKILLWIRLFIYLFAVPLPDSRCDRIQIVCRVIKQTSYRKGSWGSMLLLSELAFLFFVLNDNLAHLLLLWLWKCMILVMEMHDFVRA